jgi:hypothetical protein
MQTDTQTDVYALIVEKIYETTFQEIDLTGVRTIPKSMGCDFNVIVNGVGNNCLNYWE